MFAIAALAASSSPAHVGSPDVFFKGNAGPYPLLITVRPPDVVPGVARVEVRSLGEGVQSLELTPTPMTGPAAKHPPVADRVTASATDATYFEGTLWLMTNGAWEVHIRVNGTQGPADLAIPVPAVALTMQPMSRGIGFFLLGMMLFLYAGLVAIAGAAVGAAKLEPGAPLRFTRESRITMAVTAVVLAAALWAGWNWWAGDAENYARKVYKPLNASVSSAPEGRLELRLSDPGWLSLRKLDDLIPDHGHITHLFLIRWPSRDYAYHLHPDLAATGYFSQHAPAMPEGDYRVFADVVHESGLEETAVGSSHLPQQTGAAVSGDDAGGAVTPDQVLTGGYRMVWNERPARISARAVTLYSFSLVDSAGAAATDLEPYIGMGGHAEFLKNDGTVFAHVHPSGSVSMASMAIASPAAMRAMHSSNIGREVSFPWGAPSPGDYTVFVQLKRAGRVETAAFPLHVG